MDLREALRGTAAIREFTDDPVPDEVVAAILDDARFAPSGGNRQPWSVALVKDPQLRRRLADAMQPVWNDYVDATASGRTPFTAVEPDRKSTRLNSSHEWISRMPSSA